MAKSIQLPARLQHDWRSSIYAFFQPDVTVTYVNGRHIHDFTCAAKSCKGNGKNSRLVRRYLDTGDRKSTSSLGRHARKCWGDETVKSVETKDIDSARKKLGAIKLRDGSITASFDRVGKGKITYSHRLHTKAETRCAIFDVLWGRTSSCSSAMSRVEIIKWVAESMRPFCIVEDDSFNILMKTGWPEHYIPS